MNTKHENEQRWLVMVNGRRVREALALLLLLPVAAWAGGVVTNCTEADLRAAMAGGGTVSFACDGTITLANTITNASDTVLDASGHQVTISGNSAVRVFCVNSNVSFTLVNLTVAGGHCDTTGAGVLNLGGTVNLLGVAFATNEVASAASGEGGAIRNELGVLNLQNCTFAGNGASGASGSSGGAIYNNGTMNATGCTFAGNGTSGALN